MQKCTSLKDALRISCLLHGPFSSDQLETESSRFSLFTNLEEVYWHIHDEYTGPGCDISELDLYYLFFERTSRQYWNSQPPSRSDIRTWQQDYKKRTQSIPVCGALILNSTMDKILLVGSNLCQGTVFTPPRGKRNEGESPEQTAIREVAEETGLDISPFLIPTEYVQFKPRPNAGSVTLFVVVTSCSGSEDIPTPKRWDNQSRNNEVSNVSWFPLHTPFPTRITTAALRLLMSWCHGKITNPGSNKQGTQNVLLQPTRSIDGKHQYHFNGHKAHQNRDYPSVYRTVKTYSAVCAGLLSVNLCDDIDSFVRPLISSGPNSIQTFGNDYYQNDYYQNDYNHSNDRAPRDRSNSNSRRRDSPQPHDNRVNNSNARSPSTSQITSAPSINLDELFNHVSLDDVFAVPVSTTPPASPGSKTSTIDNLSTTSSTQPMQQQGITTTSITTAAQHGSTPAPAPAPTTTTSAAPCAVSPLAHLLPSNSGTGSAVSSPTPATVRPAVDSKKDKTAPLVPPIIVAPVGTDLIAPVHQAPLVPSKLGNLKSRLRAPGAPIISPQPLAPK